MMELATTVRLVAFGVGFLIHVYLVILLLRDRSRTASATVFLWINALASLFHLSRIVRLLPAAAITSSVNSWHFAIAATQSCLTLLSPMFLHFLLRERHELGPVRGYRAILTCIYLESSALALVPWWQCFGFLRGHDGWFLKYPLPLYNFFLFLPASLAAGISVLSLSSLQRDRRYRTQLFRELLILFLGMAIVYFTVWIAGLNGQFPHFGWWLTLAGETSSIPTALLFAFYVYRFPFLDVVVRRGLALGSTAAVVVAFQTIVTRDLPLPGFPTEVLVAVIAIGTWTLVSRVARNVLFGRKSLIGLGFEAQQLFTQRLDPSELINRVLALIRKHLKTEGATFRGAEAQVGAIPAGGWIRSLTPDSEVSRAMDAVQSELVLPIWVGDHLFGSLWLGRRRHWQGYFTPELEMLKSLCSQMSTAIENHRLQDEARKQLILEYELRELASRAELRALRAQIQPHFLFNALNTVAGLIRENPRAAEEVIENLSEIFRYALESTQVDRVSLRDEIQFVQTYLRIEKARFEERLQVSLSLPLDCAEARLPAMTLQPIVENAVRYGMGGSRGCSRIAVIAQRLEDGVEILVQDDGDGFVPSAPSTGASHGIGLENVRSRLQLACGENAELFIRSRPGQGTTVSIKIPV